MVELPNYSQCGALGAPLDFRSAPGVTPAEKVVAMLSDASRRLEFFRMSGGGVPEEERSYAGKLCALAAGLVHCEDPREQAELNRARSVLLGALRS